VRNIGKNNQAFKNPRGVATSKKAQVTALKWEKRNIPTKLDLKTAAASDRKKGFQQSPGARDAISQN